MPDRPDVPLAPVAIEVDSPEFAIISGWPYPDSFVTRMLRDDIPYRLLFNNGRLWVYRDRDEQLVGFGSLDISDDCSRWTNGRAHPYIPLLAVNPTIRSLGYGTSIVRHLTWEASCIAQNSRWDHDALFLDVYTSSERAIRLYERCGFLKLTDLPIPDPVEAGKLYFVMAKHLSVAPV